MKAIEQIRFKGNALISIVVYIYLLSLIIKSISIEIQEINENLTQAHSNRILYFAGLFYKSQNHVNQANAFKSSFRRVSQVEFR